MYDWSNGPPLADYATEPRSYSNKSGRHSDGYRTSRIRRSTLDANYSHIKVHGNALILAIIFPQAHLQLGPTLSQLYPRSRCTFQPPPLQLSASWPWALLQTSRSTAAWRSPAVPQAATTTTATSSAPLRNRQGMGAVPHGKRATAVKCDQSPDPIF